MQEYAVNIGLYSGSAAMIASTIEILKGLLKRNA